MVNGEASVGATGGGRRPGYFCGLAVEEDAGAHAVVEKEATSMQSRCSLQIQGMAGSV